MIQPESVCLLIADISGYTEYLSTVEIDHAQDILADLIGTVVTSLRPNFRLAKLEGDAAFCFAPAEKVDGSMLLDTVERCYFSFRRRRRDVRQATACECNACVRIPSLNLKFVAHHGLALRQKVAGREELLGSDVIVVHRLLKNDIVEKMGIDAYLALSDKLVAQMDIDPAALDMREHAETYDHIGEVKLWVHDLERRWQEEEARRRVFIEPKDAFFNFDISVDVPPQVAWDFVTEPGRRAAWQAVAGVTGVEQTNNVGGRRGVGTVNHCMHGPAAVIEEILDWRPFDYFTDRSVMPGGAPTFERTMEFEPTSTGTVVHMRIAPPKKPAERKMLEQLAGPFAEGMAASVAVLKVQAPAESKDLLIDRAEPPLPEPKSADGFLEGLQPIEYVG